MTDLKLTKKWHRWGSQRIKLGTNISSDHMEPLREFCNNMSETIGQQIDYSTFIRYLLQKFTSIPFEDHDFDLLDGAVERYYQKEAEELNNSALRFLRTFK